MNGVDDNDLLRCFDGEVPVHIERLCRVLPACVPARVRMQCALAYFEFRLQMRVPENPVLDVLVLLYETR